MCLRQKAEWEKRRIQNFGWNTLKEEQVILMEINRLFAIRMEDGMRIAWMGKEKFGSPKYAPIQSVCFIERGIENEIRKIDDKEVVERLFHQLFLPEEPESLMQFMELIDGMVCEIPFFVLKCNISLAAVKVAYETLSKS